MKKGKIVFSAANAQLLSSKYASYVKRSLKESVFCIVKERPIEIQLKEKIQFLQE